MLNAISYIVSLILTVAASSLLGLTVKQLISVACFSMIFYGAIFFWRYRLAFAFFGVGALLTAGLVNVANITEFAGIDIILFLIGMMIIVGHLEEKQFFEHLMNKIISLVDMNGRLLLILMLFCSTITAALVDEVTSVLFMCAAMLHITEKYKLNPVPFVIMVVFATNIGSSATVVGNPVGIIIALRSGLGFMDFIKNAAPISLAALVLAIGLFFIYYRKQIGELHTALAEHKKKNQLAGVLYETALPPKDAIISGIIFACVVLGLVFHGSIEHLFGLEKNTMLLGTALIGASVVLGVSKHMARDLVSKRVDWWTLSFFLFLFASVGVLQYQGITAVIAQKIIHFADGNVPMLMGLCIWLSGALTSVMDNVLAVATFVPIIKAIGTAGANTAPLWWGVLFGSTLLGNLTIIGSTANIVAVGLMEKKKLGQVSFLEWLKAGIFVAIPTLILAHILLAWHLKI